MNGVDIGILAVLLISSFMSVSRGFVKEAMAFVIWVLAFFVATALAPSVSGFLQQWISSLTISLIVGFLVVFIAVILLGLALGHLLEKLVSKMGLSITDRFLGLVFGFVRGILIVSIILLFARMTSMPQETWWQNSALVHLFDPIVNWLGTIVPAQFSKLSQAISVPATGVV